MGVPKDGRRSRNKGSAGKGICFLCREEGYDARRQQYSGVEGEDVIGLPGIHIRGVKAEHPRRYRSAVRDTQGRSLSWRNRK